MFAVAALGVGAGWLVRIEGSGIMVLAVLGGLLLMMGGACAFAWVGVMFTRLTLPTTHPLSDHAVGYFGNQPGISPAKSADPADHFSSRTYRIQALRVAESAATKAGC